MRGAGRISFSILLSSLVLGLSLSGCATGGASLRKEGPDLSRLVKVDIKDTETNTLVVLEFDKPATFTSVRVTDPPKMIVNLANTDTSAIKGRIDFNKGPVSYVTPLKPFDNAKNVGRLEIGLRENATAATVQNGQVISILFDKKPAAAAKANVPDNKPEARVEPQSVPPAPKVVVVEPTVPKKNEAPKVAEATLPPARMVSSVSFAQKGETCRVSINADGKFLKPEVFRLGDDRVVVDLQGIDSMKEKQTLDVRGNCVKKIRMASHNDPKQKVRVVIDLAKPSDYDVKQEGKSLVVTVAPKGKLAAALAAPAGAQKNAAAAPTPKAEPAKAEAASAKPAAVSAPKPDSGPKAAGAVPDNKAGEGVNIYISKADNKAVLSTKPIEDPNFTKVDEKPKDYLETATKIYTGGKISFDIQDADLDKVIKLLADVSGLNLIMDPSEVKGKVTLKLDSVPWDQALDILLRIYNLDRMIEGNVLRVASKSKLDDERRKDLLTEAEQKKLMQQAEDLYTRTFKVNYSAASELEDKVKKILSPRGDATANPRTNELIITDVKANLDKVERLISILDKEVRQILIEARIVTVKTGYSQSLGLSWGLNKNPKAGEPQIGVTSGTNSSIKPQTDGTYQLALPTELGKAAGMVGSMTWFNIAKNINIDLTISALEAINKASTLAAPKVMTLENQSASITQGITLYVQTTTASGTAPQPLNANLSLTVTPRVTGDNFITMMVNATNNEPALPPAGATASINTQAVTTNVMVKDGDTIVLGGIYIKQKANVDSHIPWLGKIPLLGWLFKETTDTDSTSELLIFITPKIVKQANL
jgi:type IV pilus assembly protein PilQ